jgi:acyl-coenzyme A thioesterase PaaI-like protein
MRHEVVRKQNNSRMCFVCGLKNELGLRAAFFETDRNELVALIRPLDEHQSYPGRMHGGVAAAVLDETIGRAIAIGRGDQVWGVTVEFTMSFRKPVPLDGGLKVVGRVTKEGSRFFEGTGEIVLANGDVAVSAKGRYYKMPLDKITDSGTEGLDWTRVDLPEDPEYIDVPQVSKPS